MTLDTLTEIFGWMTLINLVLLCVATLSISLMGDFAQRIHARMFKIEEDALSGKYFDYLANFKMLWLIFNFTPWLTLMIVG